MPQGCGKAREQMELRLKRIHTRFMEPESTTSDQAYSLLDLTSPPEEVNATKLDLKSVSIDSETVTNPGVRE